MFLIEDESKKPSTSKQQHVFTTNDSQKVLHRKLLCVSLNKHMNLLAHFIIALIKKQTHPQNSKSWHINDLVFKFPRLRPHLQGSEAESCAVWYTYTSISTACKHHLREPCLQTAARRSRCVHHNELLQAAANTQLGRAALRSPCSRRHARARRRAPAAGHRAPASQTAAARGQRPCRHWTGLWN